VYVVPTANRYLAIDLGAESGRIILATLGDGRLTLEETQRFKNAAIEILGTLRWNLLGLWSHVLAGLRKSLAAYPDVKSLSVDSWGVDYVLVRGMEPMLGPAFHYRDSRAGGPYVRLRKDPGEGYIYERTGIQFMPLNSLYQLLADYERDPGRLDAADGFLMIADWFHWLLTGRRTVEETNASTTQLYDPIRRTWSWELIDRLNLPRKLFSVEVVEPGTALGPLSESIGLRESMPTVVACCTHDTGSAVAAVPAEADGDWAYLSSGTWSLIGVELSSPLLSEEARLANFTNELGFGRTVRFLKNIVGLWLLQESRRHWSENGEEFDYAELTKLAEEAEPFRSVIQPDDSRFLPPGNMPERIRTFCRETGQPIPETPGQVSRCIFESLALLYAVRLEELERLTGRTIRALHIVGGGSCNRLLNQLAANATGRKVIAGPVEATAIGNALVQAIAMGDLSDLAAARAVVRSSFPVERFEPDGNAAWQSARGRFANLAVH
jgi:rhamnulokinase